MRISFGGAASIITALIGILSRIVPHERVIYRVEDPDTNKTIGVFTTIGRAERLGEPIEDLLNPRLYTAYVMRLDARGDCIRRGSSCFRNPPGEGYCITGFAQDGSPVEVIATSSLSLTHAEVVASEGFEALLLELAARPSSFFAYGVLHCAREGYGFITGPGDSYKIFRNGSCGTSQSSFSDAKIQYQRKTNKGKRPKRSSSKFNVGL